MTVEQQTAIDQIQDAHREYIKARETLAETLTKCLPKGTRCEWHEFGRTAKGEILRPGVNCRVIEDNSFGRQRLEYVIPCDNITKVLL